MAKFRMRCPACGDMELDPSSIDLRWCSHAPASYYTYACPNCGERVTRQADGSAAQMLIAAGVRPTYFTLPAEALESHEGPSLTLDDLLDFHLLLESEDWFDAVRSLTQEKRAA